MRNPLALHPRFGDFGTGLLAYLLTSVPVCLGVICGISFVPCDRDRPNTSGPDFLTACSRFDGTHYRDIVEHGYSYDPGQRSSVAFFPLYPVTGWAAAALTGWSAGLALLVVANLMLVGAFILFAAYLRSQSPKHPAHAGWLALALFGLWPAGFFFRMTYSESTFLAVTLLVLLGMLRRWPLVVLVLLAGLATAARPVGVAVAAAILAHVVCDPSRGSVGRRLVLALASSPLACWGLIAYMAYQYVAFGHPLAFAQTQEHWGVVRPSYNDLWHKVESLLAGEPLWGVYTPDPVRNWQRLNSQDQLLFNMAFWNPIFFVAAFALVLIGAGKAWLSGPEVVLGLGLLAIPYVTRAYEQSMASHARFAALVVPAYIVLGRILQAQPKWLAWSVFALLSMMLVAWSALFAAGHALF
jgi:hypothetical protein